MVRHKTPFWLPGAGLIRKLGDRQDTDGGLEAESLHPQPAEQLVGVCDWYTGRDATLVQRAGVRDIKGLLMRACLTLVSARNWWVALAFATNTSGML